MPLVVDRSASFADTLAQVGSQKVYSINKHVLRGTAFSRKLVRKPPGQAVSQPSLRRFLCVRTRRRTRMCIRALECGPAQMPTHIRARLRACTHARSRRRRLRRRSYSLRPRRLRRR